MGSYPNLAEDADSKSVQSGFESQRAYHVSPSSSAVRTSPFQGGNAGSSPAGDTNLFDLFIKKIILFIVISCKKKYLTAAKNYVIIYNVMRKGN